MTSFLIKDQLESPDLLELSSFTLLEVQRTQDLLNGHPNVRTAVARIIETHAETHDQNSDLVAFIVPQPDVYANFCLDTFRREIEKSLPAGRAPQGYVILPSLPLDSVGRIDEAALMALPVAVPALDQKLEGLLSALSEVKQVAALWKVLPPVEKGVHISDLLPANKSQSPASLPSRLTDSTEESTIADRAVALSDGGDLTIPRGVPETLTEALLRTAATYPNKGMCYIEADGTAIKLSYAELLEQARCILTGLRQAGLSPGDKVILQTQTFSDHFPTFWACLLGGIIPITIAVAPVYDENNAVARKLFNIWNNLNHVPILASSALVGKIENLQHCLPMTGVAVLLIETLRQNPPATALHPTKPAEVVFIQLSSGSTGVPKCIQITHQGVVAHIHASQQFNGYSPDDVSLNWLPLDHVVPMLTFHLKDIYLGCQQIEVATSLVISDPLQWLRLMAEHRVTHSWSPNFGFKLVSNALDLLVGAQNQWDLSAVKLLMNAGEQVTRSVVDDFLARVAPFGVRSQVMQPAFGMAELCTCMTYQNEYAASTWGYRVAKSSLRSQLQEVDQQHKSATDFVHLGPPVPGVQMRIVDSGDALLKEGVIGRLQIKGAVVTPGYLNNDEANAEAFVGNGWFNTGDLGFLLNRHLVITGREKEIIIVNGANFYCYEIEDVVNAIAGVHSTYTAAVSYHNELTGTESLVVFFVPIQEALADNVALIKSIKTQITASLGISPTYVLPLSKQRFPKTTSGKIQRMGLKTGLLSGEFDALIKAVEIELGNNTLPNWFYRPGWQRKAIDTHPARAIADGHTVVFLDAVGLGEQFCHALTGQGQGVITVIPGRQFSQAESTRYAINPRRPEDYDRLFSYLLEQGISISQVVHLWTYAPPSCISNVAHLEEAQIWGSLSLLSLVQSINRYYLANSSLRVSLQVVSSHTQRLREADELAVERSPMLGLLKTIVQEMPQITCRHIDLSGDFASDSTAAQLTADCDRLLAETASAIEEATVAYRDQQRWVQKLERVDFVGTSAQPLPFKQGGFYLVSGGLGGVGQAISKYLLENYDAKLLILGRTPLSTCDSIKLEGTADTRQQAYQSLLAIGKGEVRYAAVELTDVDRLNMFVRQARESWQCELEGILHLAGVFEERLLMAEQPASFLRVLKPKMGGTWVLHQLVKHNPKAIFINFSSVNGFFGGQSVGAYAAANSFVECFSNQQQQTLQSYCYAWSMWNDLGMSKGYRLKALTRTKGFHLIEPEQGLISLWAGLSHRHTHLIVGLDGGNANIYPEIKHPVETHQKLVVYVTTKSPGLSATNLLEWIMSHSGAALRDRFNTAIVPCVEVLESLPVTKQGDIDKAALRVLSADKKFVAPRTPLEESLAEIWRSLLGFSHISCHDNFFEIGGNSLLTAQLIVQIKETLGKQLDLCDLFAAPTVAALSDVIAGIADTPTEVMDLESEAILSNDIYPSVPFVFTSSPKAILLTGATGFLGGSLLAALLEQTSAVIFCLVRATTLETAFVRIRENLAEQALWKENLARRIVPVLGDLSKPHLGLCDEDFATITHEVDTIYHNGAWVNFTYPYSALKQVNVIATEEILRIASLVRIKPVHFVSTISVCFSKAYKGKVVKEDEPLRAGDDLLMGYAQTKWVCERLLSQARDRGMPVCIYRPGRIMGHSVTGYSNTQDLICRMLKQVVQMGSAPTLTGAVDMTPVDFVSRALVQLSLQEDSFGRVFHLINPELLSWQQIFEDIQALGYSIEPMSCVQWRQRLLAIAQSDPQQALHPLLDLFSAAIPFELEEPHYDCQNVLEGLGKTSTAFSSVGREALANYFSYFTRVGYVSAVPSL